MVNDSCWEIYVVWNVLYMATRHLLSVSCFSHIQLCSNPMGRSLPGLLCPEILQVRIFRASCHGLQGDLSMINLHWQGYYYQCHWEAPKLEEDILFSLTLNNNTCEPNQKTEAQTEETNVAEGRGEEVWCAFRDKSMTSFSWCLKGEKMQQNHLQYFIQVTVVLLAQEGRGRGSPIHHALVWGRCFYPLGQSELVHSSEK